MPLWVGILITVVWLLTVLFWRVNRVWLPYYVTGTVGMAFLLIFFGAQATPLQEWLQLATVWSVHHLSTLFQITTQDSKSPDDSTEICSMVQPMVWEMTRIMIVPGWAENVCVVI